MDEKRFINNFEMILYNELSNIFEDKVDIIKEKIINSYDEELFISDYNSKAHPLLYRDTFVDRLDNFNFVTKEKSKVTIESPDIESFDFSGRLKIIKNITYGIPGKYVEVNTADYILINNRVPDEVVPIDDEAIEKFYLLEYDDKIRAIENNLNRKFTYFPFSNKPPINFLKASEVFVDENINSWIEEALTIANNKFTMRY